MDLDFIVFSLLKCICFERILSVSNCVERTAMQYVNNVYARGKSSVHEKKHVLSNVFNSTYSNFIPSIWVWGMINCVFSVYVCVACGITSHLCTTCFSVYTSSIRLSLTVSSASKCGNPLKYRKCLLFHIS